LQQTPSPRHPLCPSLSELFLGSPGAVQNAKTPNVNVLKSLSRLQKRRVMQRVGADCEELVEREREREELVNVAASAPWSCPASPDSSPPLLRLSTAPPCAATAAPARRTTLPATPSTTNTATATASSCPQGAQHAAVCLLVLGSDFVVTSSDFIIETWAILCLFVVCNQSSIRN